MYNRSNPYSTKHSQGKNEHFCFSPAFFKSPLPPTATTTTFRPLFRRSPSCGSCGRRCVLEWCDGWRWVRSHPFWWVGWGGLCCFSSFRRTTSCQSYYGSTVDTTVFPLIHTLGQQALCSVSRVGRSAELILFNNILLKLCIYLYVIVHIYNQS